MRPPEGYDRIPEEYLVALGEISANVSLLEGAISVCISSLVFESGDLSYNYNLTACLAGSEHLDILIKKLEKLFVHMVSDKKMLEQFNTLRIKLEGIKDDRNTYLHSSWHRGPYWLNKENEVDRSKPRRQISSSGMLFDFKEAVPIEELTNLVRRSKAALHELYDFILPNVKVIQEQSRVKHLNAAP